MSTKQTTDLFNILGIMPSYKGYFYLVHMIEIACNYHGKPFPCMKNLISQTAAYFNVSPSVVIHDIRTLLRTYWDQDNASTFSNIVHYPVKDKLTIKEFIAVIAEYLSLYQ